MPAAAQSTSISPAVAAFWRRNASGDAKKSRINQPGIIDIKQYLKQKRPKLSSKIKAGAPKGNRNAVTMGLHTQVAVARRREVREMVAKMKLLTAQVRASTARKEAKITQMLLRAGLPRRSIWFCE
ncbi:MAG TPA: hypothetical protein VGH02_05320 [Rhizomicrobium sp.]|jgi:hypothetical protein